MIIKKLNSMFHKHSRWIFGIFAAVIIIAFMDFLTPGQGGCAFSGGPESQSVGTAFGKKVTYGDLIDLENELQIFESVIGNRSQREPKVLFYYYCVLKRAEQLNFTIGDKEIAKIVRILPVFVENGKFSQQKYADFLKKNQIAEADLVESIRKALIIEQLPMAMTNSVTVTEQEIENLYRSNFPRVGIRAYKVKAADFAKLVKVDDAELNKFMAANKANYVIPGKIDALGVELPAAPFKAAAEKVITNDFTEKFIKERNLTGADVKTIRPLLVDQKANELASVRMNSFYREVLNAMDAAKDAAAKKEIFRNIAAKNKFTVIEGKDVTFDASGIDKINSAELIAELRSMPLSDSVTPITRPRKSANGHEYIFSEGTIAFPDPWDRPGRTMLTSESTLNRSTHVVSDPGTGRLRILTPVEAERLQGFDDEWTNSGMPDRMRYFCMGNALVVPMITRMGKILDTIISQEP